MGRNRSRSRKRSGTKRGTKRGSKRGSSRGGKRVVYLKKSNRPGKKYMVYVDGKTVHFGATGYSDYTKHKDSSRMSRYSTRHGSGKGRENWSGSGIKTAGFWSKWLLWNKPSIAASKRDMASRFKISFRSGWPK